jgi:CBS domain-containing protein
VKVSEIMSSPVITVDAQASVAQLLALLKEHSISGLPVVDGEGALAGIVSRQDVILQELRLLGSKEPSPSRLSEILNGGFVTVPAEGFRSQTTKVGEIMTPAAKVRTCRKDTSLTEACALMAENRIHRLPVIAGGRIVGILSTTDIVRAVADGRI